MGTHITLRSGTIDDIEAVYQLNRSTFSEYWSRTSLFSSLESGYDLWLCESQGMLAGYLLSLTILDEMQIMQIAVSKAHQRQGLATRMTNACITAININSITLEVRLSNHAARACYIHLGFEEVGCRKNYYAPDASGMREDAILMTRKL